MCVCLQEFLISEDFNKMNHVKTYPGEETSAAQNRAAVGPDGAILADFGSGNASWAAVHLACSHLDTVSSSCRGSSLEN